MCGAPTLIAARSVLFSYQTGAHRESGRPRPGGDATDREYARCARRFTQMLHAGGVKATELLRPEIFPRECDRRALFGEDRPTHLIFKRPEDIRLLKGAYNIGVLVWNEVEVDGGSTDRPFSDERRMLALLDEIWAPSRFVQKQLEAAGLGNVHVIPCPFADVAGQNDPHAAFDGIVVRRWRPPDDAPPVTLLTELLDDRDEARTLVVTVIDTDAWRADLAATVDGFLAVASPAPPAALIVVRRDGLDATALAARLDESCSAAIHPDRQAMVGIVQSPMTDRQIVTLLGQARFYVCTSRLEGQNLPLIEAMAAGCIPVTVRHSAMADYANDTNSVAIPTFPKRLTRNRGSRSRAFLAPKATAASCAAGLREALTLEPGERGRLSAEAKRVADRTFGTSAVRSLALGRLSMTAA